MDYEFPNFVKAIFGPFYVCPELLVERTEGHFCLNVFNGIHPGLSAFAVRVSSCLITLKSIKGQQGIVIEEITIAHFTLKLT